MRRADAPAHAGYARGNDVRYRRNPAVDQETFEDELLLLDRASGTVLALNLPAAALWDALGWPQSLDDLARILVEAWPDQEMEWARAQASSTLDDLVAHCFVLRADH